MWFDMWVMGCCVDGCFGVIGHVIWGGDERSFIEL